MADEPYIVFGSPSIGEAEIEAVSETLRSCWIGTGPRVCQFEEAFRSYLGAKHTVAVNSCSAALHLAMIASGVGPGDEIITTPMTFAATANAIVHTGAVPAFVDVDRETMNIPAAQVESRITERTKGVLPVHLAGRPCEMDAITAIAQRHNLMVIEDAAHAIEAWYRGQKIGTISPLTCFSFYVTKNLTTAEGGMVAVNDGALVERIKVRAMQGLSADAWTRFKDERFKHYEVVCPGFKYNMTDMQAVLGLCQLRNVNAWLERRNEIWQRYDDAFAGLPCQTPAPVEGGTVHARHLYTVLINLEETELTRDQVMLDLHRRGIGTGVHYRALHLHEYYRSRFGFRPEDFPVASWISERTLSLPLSAKLSDEDVSRIVRGVTAVLGASRHPALKSAHAPRD